MLSNAIIFNIAVTYYLVTAFESQLPFQVSASVTRLRVVSVCPPISRFPFDCFFLLPSSFCLSCRDSRRFFCVGQFSGVQTRPIVVAHAPSPFSVSFRRCRGSLAQSAPFFRPILPSRSFFILRPSPLPVDFTNGI